MKIYWLTTGNHFTDKAKTLDSEISKVTKDGFKNCLYTDNYLASVYLEAYYNLFLNNLITSHKATIGATPHSKYYLKLNIVSHIRHFSNENNIEEIESTKPLTDYNSFICFDNRNDIENFIKDYNIGINTTFKEPSIIF